ncbi:HXXEE domain-containing protein [Aquibacillus rhizosphaerae]|uniref:HXXEE domain-containing protein n=1 Tax=Aquibacillus rhizosphaerae TaxID=3051431 RepID=A0ABT7L6L2_9BACI|nr:HXXEE domain-containing protein [Aquibacillus sp. LR5S19]MDL4840246.1 HXXEE domain-containing protein [Aquibacillus sp. LR5S19]
MFQLELYNAIWLFVVIFMLHDFEEIIAVEKWAMKNKNRITVDSKWISNQIWKFWNVNSYSFAKRDVFIFLIMSIITFIKIQNLESSWSAVMYLSFLIFVLIHNVAHVVQTWILKTYTPGLYTAIFLLTPYIFYLLSRLIHN